MADQLFVQKSEKTSEQNHEIKEYSFEKAVGDFNYTIDFDNTHEMIQITGGHDVDKWSVIQSDNISKSSSNGFQNELTPRDIFNNLYDHYKGTLDPLVKVEYQTKFKACNVPISIEIQIFSPAKKNTYDSKQIILNPVEITEIERLIKKIDLIEKCQKGLRTELKTEYDTLNKSISVLRNNIVDDVYTVVETDELISNLTAKTIEQDKKIADLITKLASVYTKAEIDTKYATHYTKAEIDAKHALHYTKAESDSKFTAKS